MALALFFSGQSTAQVYKTINPDGSVTYTDQALDDAQAINVAPVQQYSSPVNKTKQTTSIKEEEAPDNGAPTLYTDFSIISPKHDTAIRANTGAVTVTLSITPALNVSQGDKVSLSLNGQPVGAPSAQISFPLNNLNRGSHTLSASLQNATGETIKTTAPVTFHILKTHIKH